MKAWIVHNAEPLNIGLTLCIGDLMEQNNLLVPNSTNGMLSLTNDAYIELVCSVCEVLEMDAQNLLEKILAYPKAETMIMALCSSVMVKND